jgi:hypothetical protein
MLDLAFIILLKKLSHNTMAGFDLTIHRSAIRDDAARAVPALARANAAYAWCSWTTALIMIAPVHNLSLE